MTKILFRSLLIAGLFLYIPQSIQAQRDSAKSIPDSILKLPARVTVIEKNMVEQKPATKDSLQTNCNSCAIQCNIDINSIGWHRWLLIFLPILLFFIIGGFFIYKILKGKFDLADALSTGKPQTEAIVRAADGTETTTTKPIGSTSRLIAFLCGITAILIAMCLLTYYAYFTLAECGGNLKFEEMWKILAGLGIGIVPYGINVWRGNNKEKDDDTKKDNG